MKQLASTDSINRKLWLSAMILSMLFVQSLQLHVHTYTHNAELLGHVHYDSAHSVFDFSQDAHADEVAQHDMNLAGLMSKLSDMPLLATILSLLLALCVQSCAHLGRYQLKPSGFKDHSERFRPPLRAPPRV